MAVGENTERLWSSLDNYAYLTHEMTAAIRQNLLTDVLICIEEQGIDNADMASDYMYLHHHHSSSSFSSIHIHLDKGSEHVPFYGVGNTGCPCICQLPHAYSQQSSHIQTMSYDALLYF